jgi:hypothetical protein
LTCAILRLEGPGGKVLYNNPFSSILHGRRFDHYTHVSYGETFAIAFYPVADDVQANRIAGAVSAVKAITRKVVQLLRGLPKAVQESLRLPDCDDWWRIAFHLGWHLPRPFLSPLRYRLLTRDGTFWGMTDEVIVQLHGTGGRNDLLPGLIYSVFQDNDDLCTCSEAAIQTIIDAVEREVQFGQAAGDGARILSAEQRRGFDQLRVAFDAGTQLPNTMGALECKLLKLADSFTTPPASAWAGLRVGGCHERFVTLSRLNSMHEIAQIRGPATDWFCEVAERAGKALPPFIPDYPILFDDPQRGFGGPRPVTNRDPVERWVGFVFATIKRLQPEALSVRWEANIGPLAHGLATLDRDLFGASVLAIDLARLTSAAEEASSRQRATCSPFSVPSMEEQGFQWAEQTPPPPPPPTNYTMARLVEDLRRFGENYYHAVEQIQEQTAVVQKHSRIELGASVTSARASLQTIPGFTELREQVRSLWNEEISPVTARRTIDVLVQRSAGILSTADAEDLTLAEAAALLTSPLESWEKLVPERLKRGHAEDESCLNQQSALVGRVPCSQQDRLHIDEIDSFAQVRSVERSAVADLLVDGRIDIPEDSIKRAIEEILHVPFHHRDRPDELDDIYTANVVVKGSRRPTAFMLKGPGIGKNELTIADCGKNGDQLVRLFDAPADLFVVQFVGRIAEMVIKDVEGKIAALHKREKKAQYLIVDGQDTARLLVAYDKLRVPKRNRSGT